MPLVTTHEILLDAQKGKYAVGAFNVENMEMVKAVIEAAEELNAPVILQTTPSTVKYAGIEYLINNAKAAADRSRVPIAFHLDHGTGFDLTIQALRAGYTSIMIDGSHKSFEENIQITKRIVDSCKPVDVPVEAELGKVGGKEDDMDGGEGDSFTDPLQAKEFVERTGISSLAIAIGSAHGLYKGEPKLDLQRLEEIQALVDIPLVLHGASGIPDDMVRASITRGICKVNFATELRIAYTKGVHKVLEDDPDTFDPKKYGSLGKLLVKEFVMNRMKVCGCDNKY